MSPRGVHAIVGHSVGGAVALLATRFGLRASRLALVAPPTSPLRFAAWFRERLGINSHVHGAMLARLEARYGIALADLDVRRDAAAFAGRLVVVHDEDDRVVPWSHGAMLAAATPDGVLVTTQGLGHGRILEDPAVVRRIVDAIADGAEARSFADTLEGELYLRDTRW